MSILINQNLDLNQYSDSKSHTQNNHEQQKKSVV